MRRQSLYVRRVGRGGFEWITTTKWMLPSDPNHRTAWVEYALIAFGFLLVLLGGDAR
jgi:hypothetical protein